MLQPLVSLSQDIVVFLLKSELLCQVSVSEDRILYVCKHDSVVHAAATRCTPNL